MIHSTAQKWAKQQTYARGGKYQFYQARKGSNNVHTVLMQENHDHVLLIAEVEGKACLIK